MSQSLTGSADTFRSPQNLQEAISEMFSAFKLLSDRGILETNIAEQSSAADPIIKKITGKGFVDYLQEKMFSKHGRDRLTRLVRVHSYRLKTNMAQDSVKFFTTLAKKVINFIEKTPLLKQVFQSVQGLTQARANVNAVVTGELPARAPSTKHIR